MATKLVRWLHYLDTNAVHDFPGLARFVEDNPDWPRRGAMRRRAEAAMGNRLSDALVVSWLTKHPPVSSQGRIRLAEALLSLERVGEAQRWLRQVWVEDDLGRRQSRAFYKRFRRYLRMADNTARLDRLLWNGKRGAARRMLPLVPKGQRALAEARLALMGGSSGVNARISRVPSGLRNDPGLVYERIRWRRKRGRDESARKLLQAFGRDRGQRPDKWWTERRVHTRQLLKEGQFAAAYDLAQAHGQKAGSVPHAEAEWLAGWIVFRFLNDNDKAALHFRQLYEAARYPLSRSRGAYWRARVSEAQGRVEHAARWYRNAAQFQTTFYGQLAAEALDANAILRLQPTPVPRPDQRAGFKRREAVRVAELLGVVGQWKLFRRFILHLNRQAKTPVEHAMIAGLATRFRRYELAIRVSKQATRSGQQIIGYGYPLFRLPKIDADRALVFAIMRQESEFGVTAVSTAGARGLMQLMPRTARAMARSLGLRYSGRKLLSDPRYNVRLGSAYISSMLEEFGGFYPLAIVAYNAGPGRTGEWLETYGDPRNPDVDVIDWIEMIPFNETRNYVQRVLEGLQIYRMRLAERPVRSRLAKYLAPTAAQN